MTNYGEYSDKMIDDLKQKFYLSYLQLTCFKSFQLIFNQCLSSVKNKSKLIKCLTIYLFIYLFIYYLRKKYFSIDHAISYLTILSNTLTQNALDINNSCKV